MLDFSKTLMYKILSGILNFCLKKLKWSVLTQGTPILNREILSLLPFTEELLNRFSTLEDISKNNS